MDIERQLGVFGGVRGRFRDLDPLTDANDNTGYALYVSAAPVTPLGHTRQTITTTAAPITGMPTGAKRVHIYNLSTENDVFFTDLDGQTPDATLGFPIKADSWLMYDSEPTDDLLFATTTGTASVAFAFYA
jgi:hypothetical protein